MDLTDSSLWKYPQTIFHIELLKSQPPLLTISDYYPQEKEPLVAGEQQACCQSPKAQETYGEGQNPLEQPEDQIWTTIWNKNRLTKS